jgi:hypothetical protein
MTLLVFKPYTVLDDNMINECRAAGGMRTDRQN